MLFAKKTIIKRAFFVSTLVALILSSLFVPAHVKAVTVTYTEATVAPEHKLALWYDRPATDWENEALPIGNSNIGGMVFGTVEQERIQYNEKTLWTGGPDTTNYTPSANAFILNNLWETFDTHPPFQIDGNLGLTSGMAEMLVQSHLETIDILPALPSDWSTGSYTGLCARGGFTVGVVWEQSRAQTITIKSTAGNRAKLFYPSIKGVAVTDDSDSVINYTVASDDRIEFDTHIGKTYTITGISSSMD